MIGIIQDFRYAIRGLRKSPGFTTVAVLTLALGIGANTAIFIVFDTVILRPLSYRQPSRLYVIHEVLPAIASRMPLAPVNALHFREWRATTKSFEDMALLGPVSYTLAGHGDAMRVDGARATPSLFRTLGVDMAFG